MNVLINGTLGRMGREVKALCKRGCYGAVFVMGVDKNADGTDKIYPSFDALPTADGVDCIIDFSHHSAVGELLDFAENRGIPTVVATTGHTGEELARIRSSAGRIPVFLSANMSLGVALLTELARMAAIALPDAEVEIIEKHHNKKLDAPSGTALMIADAICDVRDGAYINSARCGLAKRAHNEIGIHAVRMGDLIGEHEVIIGTDNQTMTLKHEVHSRILFAEGALAAADFVKDCAPGLYGMKSLISGERKYNKAKEEQRI